MAFFVAGLMRDPHQARGVIRALTRDGFNLEELDMTGGPVAALVACGVPERDAHVLAEGIRRGGAIVTVRAHDGMEAERAALVMNQHGVVDIQACARGWRSQGWKGRIAEPMEAVTIEGYAFVFGDYPGGAGTIYRVPYRGPERRRLTRPYAGFERRAI